MFRFNTRNTSRRHGTKVTYTRSYVVRYIQIGTPVYAYELYTTIVGTYVRSDYIIAKA